jgi:hypothetical protein
MPYLFDEFGQRKEVSSGTFYVSGVVDRLFDDMLEILGGRIKVAVFRQNWYQLVPFILFVIRLAHVRADRDLERDIVAYISDQDNPESYLNAFNNPEYSTLKRYESAWLVEAATDAYNKYWEIYQSNEGAEDSSFAINEYLGERLAAGGEDHPNLHDAFTFLFGKFEKGEVKLFES